MGEIKLKYCSKCGQDLPLDQFYKCKRSKDGLVWKCKSCSKNYDREFYQKNKENLLFKNREYENSEKGKLNRQRVNKKHSQTDKGKRSRKRANDKRRDNGKLAQWLMNSYNNNKKFKICRILRAKLTQTLKGKDRSIHTLDLLGCSLEHFKQYIESQFQEGMTWENHTKKGWHLDHKRPCASFDLSDTEQQKICFHYTNFQPLWCIENIKKGSLYKGKRYNNKNKYENLHKTRSI